MLQTQIAEGESVDLRLDVVAESGRAVLRIHGRLSGAAVIELERVCRSVSEPLILDLAHLTSADDAGIETLKRLATDRVECTGVSRQLARRLGWEEA